MFEHNTKHKKNVLDDKVFAVGLHYSVTYVMAQSRSSGTKHNGAPSSQVLKQSPPQRIMSKENKNQTNQK